MTTALTPVVELAQGRPVCTSLNMAKHFGKRHADVLRSVEALKSDLDQDFCERNFALTSIRVDMPKGGYREEPAYQLTRDGFTLLVMGFTGRRALAWKVKYIQAFNAMEAELLRLRQAPPLPADLEQRLARLELAVSGEAEELFLARLRAQAEPLLCREMLDFDRTTAAGIHPHDASKRRALEAQLIRMQLDRLTSPRPRRRHKTDN